MEMYYQTGSVGVDALVRPLLSKSDHFLPSLFTMDRRLVYMDQTRYSPADWHTSSLTDRIPGEEGSKLQYLLLASQRGLPPPPPPPLQTRPALTMPLFLANIGQAC